MSSRERRTAENAARACRVNEQIRRAAEFGGVTDERIPFICECGHESCDGELRLTLEEYTLVRADPVRLVLAPDHERLRAARAVTEAGRVVREPG